MSIADIYYQYYFGRYPENRKVAEYHNKIASNNNLDLRNYLEKSDEFKKNFRDVTSSRVGTYFSPSNSGPKICVLGNCQGPNIARAISAISYEEVSVCGLEIMDIASSPKEIDSIIENSDFILACKTYNKEYEKLSYNYIEKKYNKTVIEYSPVHFLGLHPDIIYLGSQKNRILSPLGDYNSEIVVSSFLKGSSISDCINTFNNKKKYLEKFYKKYHDSLDEMIRREENLNNNCIRIYDWFSDNLKKEPLLYTTNHPTSSVFLQYAKEFLKKINIKQKNIHPTLLQNTLSNQVIWPIYERISQHHNLSYTSDQNFWKNSVSVSFEEFIWRSYKSYENYDINIVFDAFEKYQNN